MKPPNLAVHLQADEQRRRLGRLWEGQCPAGTDPVHGGWAQRARPPLGAGPARVATFTLGHEAFLI